MKSDLEIVSVLWVCTCCKHPVGIVKVYDLIEERYKYYIGTGNGFDEDQDIQMIIDFGQKFYDINFIAESMKAERKTKNEA